jgi:putative flippase GtrA
VPVGLTRQLVRFAAVGTASTLTYVALYALLCQGLGLGAQAANLAALGVTAVANTAANRRLTFGTAEGTGPAATSSAGCRCSCSPWP